MLVYTDSVVDQTNPGCGPLAPVLFIELTSVVAHDDYRWKKTRSGEWIQGERWGVSDEPGTVFCKAKDGAPPNPRLGDADRGICSKQFCVNDLEHKVNNR
jgi:hypothetical protein